MTLIRKLIDWLLDANLEARMTELEERVDQMDHDLTVATSRLVGGPYVRPRRPARRADDN